MNDEWYADEDDYPCCLEEDEVFLNTIWEECTADLKSKSTIDFTSFNSDDVFTSFNSSSGNHVVFDRQDSQDSLFSLKEESTDAARLSNNNNFHGEEEEEQKQQQEQSCLSSSSDDDDMIVQDHQHRVNQEEEQHGDESSLNETVEVSHHQRLEAESVPASPRTSSFSSSPNTKRSLSHHHTIEPSDDVLLSPRSPLEILTVEAMMEQQRSNSIISKQASSSSSSSDDGDVDDDEYHCSCSKRIDFSGGIIEHKVRELKRERIRSKMKAIEDKVVQAKVMLNIHYNNNASE